MIEEWKYIKDFEDYMISNFGRVMSLKGGRQIIIKPRLHKGYLLTGLRKNGKKYPRTIHLLVWDHFSYASRNGRILQVDHIDNNKLNNRIDNLQLMDSRSNVAKGFLHKGKGGNKKSSKYTGVSLRKDRQLYCAYIVVNKKQKHLGYYIKEEDARDAYLNALNNIA